MNKKERYIKYIVDDMVKKTIEDERSNITFPYFPEDRYKNAILWRMESDRVYFEDFADYVIKFYGVKDIEIEPLYDDYVSYLQYGEDTKNTTRYIVRH